MIKHVFLLTWNKKGQHIFLIIELFFFFLAISLLCFATKPLKFLKTESENFHIDNLVVIKLGIIDTLGMALKNDIIREIKEVKDISATSKIPYYNSYSEVELKKGVRARRYYADENLARILGLTLEQGRWFVKTDWNASRNAIVIDENFQRLVFPNTDPINKVITMDGKPCKVIGIIKNLNDPASSGDSAPEFYECSESGYYSLLVKLSVPLNDRIYIELDKWREDSYGNNGNFEVIAVRQYKDDHDKERFTFTFMISLVSGFLVVNIVLGLFSILYQTINKRKSEIGIRRAAGATAGDIYKQIVAEVLVLATFALVFGAITGYQFLLFDTFNEKPVNYVTAMCLAAGFIYILVAACALYPASLAAKIQPADALHDD
jgi:putative ABC transport system permease protein